MDKMVVFGKFQEVMEVPSRDEDMTDDEYGEFISEYLYDETINNLNRSSLRVQGWMPWLPGRNDCE